MTDRLRGWAPDAAVGLAVLSLPIMQVLFQRGAFGAADALATAHVLSAYALGLPAYVLVKVLVPGFFARKDTRTPVKIAVVCLIANIVFILILLWPLAEVGIALATRPLALVGAFTALGVAWSAMGAIPYAAAGAAAAPGRGAATLRRFGFSTVLPQAVTTLAIAVVIGRWHIAARAVLLAGAGAMAAGGALALLWRATIMVPAEDW